MAQAVGLAFKRTVDPSRIKDTFPDFLRLAAPIVSQGKARSAAMATGYLTGFRAAALDHGIGAEGPTPEPQAAVNDQALAKSLTIVGLVSALVNIGKGVPADDALDTAAARTAASAMRYALNGGRETILDTTARDPVCLGWQRIASATACDFCAGMADGTIFASEDEAGFGCHDGCACSAEPVYDTTATDQTTDAED